MLNRTKKHRSGFTIIEIMIVLAIAGLIMLIVFLAVPALQRSAANTSRKNDAGRISSAINDFVSNSNGNLPGTTAAWSTDCATIVSDAGSLSEYKTVSCPGSSVAALGTALKFDWFAAGSGANPLTTANTVANDALVLATGATCGTYGVNAATATGGTSRQAALFYTIEDSNNTWVWDCIQAE